MTKGTLSGLATGSFCGAITAPVDKIKTLVQAKEYSLTEAIKAVWRDLGSAKERRLLAEATFTRAIYMGLGVALLNMINMKLPQFMPKNMKE